MAVYSCPVPGCQGHRNQGHLMCRRHWRMVPANVQREVWDAWDAYRSALRGDDAEEKLHAAQRHRAASDAAVSSIAVKAF